MLPAGRAILFADDDPDDRFFMIQTFQEIGLADRLSVVEDGQEAVDYLSTAGRFASNNARAGLAILDLNMPRMNGFEALQWIRKSERHDCLPVLIFSASCQPQDIKRAYQLGACAYIVKPSTPQELIELGNAIKSFWLRFAEYP